MNDSYTKAVECFNKAEYSTAEDFLIKILKDNKHDYQSLNFLGTIKMLLREYSEAAKCFKQSIAINGNDFNTHYNLGLCHQHLKEYESALEEYQASLKINPNNVDALNNSGIVFSLTEKYGQSEKCYNLALRISPGNKKTLINLANLKLKTGRTGESKEIFVSILKEDNRNAVNHYNLGNYYLEVEQYEKAAVCFKDALQIDQTYFDAYLNLGLSLQKQRLIDEAINVYQKALDITGDKADIFFNLAKCYQDKGVYEEAVALFSKSVTLKPELRGAYVNIADIFWKKKRKDEAEKYYRLVSEDETALMLYFNNAGLKMLSKKIFDKALRYFDIALTVQKDNPEIHYNKSHIYLLTGNLKKGWAEYEWREKRKDFPQREFSKPPLSSIDIFGKKILVYDEQGIGDSIQFFRYIPLLKKNNATVIFECYQVMECLYKGFDFIDILIQNNKKEPQIDYDYRISLPSLPNYFGTTLDSIPDGVPYLFADKNLSGLWQKKIRDNEDFKVGLVWAGSPSHKNDKNRSCKLEKFSTLFKIANTDFYSLQKGNAVEEAIQFNKNIKILNEEIKTLSDTAAIIDNLDLIITVDTSVAHLAGAMGKDVWVLLPYLPDWRWLENRSDSPWYPSMKLFRQSKQGDWESVIKKVHSELISVAQNKRSLINSSFTKYNFNCDAEKKIYLGMAKGGNFGWGVCSKYLKKELSKKINLINIDENIQLQQDGVADGKVIHALIDKGFSSLYNVKGTKNYGYTFFENELTEESVENAKKYNLIFGGSTWCAEKMREKGITNSDVLLQGVDPEIFYPVFEKTNEDIFVIFSGGKFELRKGQDIVLKAIQILQQKYKNIILLNAWYNYWPQTMSLLGKSKFIRYNYSGNSWQEIMTNIYRINNIDEKRIFTLPLVENEKMREVYAKTDLGLFPNRCEGGTNLVLMEYMACGKPVAASFNTGHKDILTETNSIKLKMMREFILSDNNGEVAARWEEPYLDEVISAIEFAYYHRDDIKTLGKQAAEDMKKLTWADTANVLLRKVFKST